MEDQVFERGEGIARIFNLVDACHRCGLAFRLAAERLTDDPFRHYADELRQLLDRCSFELHTEIRRIDGGDFGPPHTYVEPCDDIRALNERCQEALRDVLQSYDEILDRHVSAHARAMIRRHAQLLRQMTARFEEQLQTPRM